MEIRVKIRFLLIALYEKKYDGKYYNVLEYFTNNGISSTSVETSEMVHTLENDGFVKSITIADKVYAQITVDGVEFLEENNFFSDSSYVPSDRIKPLEREILREKLDALYNKLVSPQFAHLFAQAEVEKEIEELRELLHILGKRSWIQILKEKVIELGCSKLAEETATVLLHDFEVYSYTEGSQISQQKVVTADV